jgi:hypothetical protein
LKRDRKICFLVFGAIFLAVLSCGKKGPPFLPNKILDLKVDQLRCEWENGDVILKGQVVPLLGQEKDMSGVIGCRVYHAWYAPGDSPCKGCPIEYRVWKEIRGEVITGEGFYCRVPWIKEKGIHFFNVILIGQKGMISPPSNKAELVVN